MSHIPCGAACSLMIWASRRFRLSCTTQILFGAFQSYWPPQAAHHQLHCLFPCPEETHQMQFTSGKNDIEDTHDKMTRLKKSVLFLKNIERDAQGRFQTVAHNTIKSDSMLQWQSQPLMPALQARCLRETSLLSHNVRNWTAGARHQVHKEREVARLRQCCIAAVAHAHCQKRANAVVVRCLQKRAPHVGLSWQILIRKETIAGGRPRRDATRATTRDMKLPLVRGDAGGSAELEQVRRRLDQNIEQRCCDKKGSWAETQGECSWESPSKRSDTVGIDR